MHREHTLLTLLHYYSLLNSVNKIVALNLFFGLARTLLFFGRAVVT
jgi:hypothetical protein